MRGWWFFFSLLILGSTVAAAADTLTLFDAIDWLEKEAHRIIRASQRTMQDGTAAFPPQVGLGYEAFWLRDYAYTLEGSVDSYSDQELKEACRLFVKSLRTDGAGVDCIKFDGTPIYMPGFGTLGKNPVADGSQFTVDVAWHTFRKTRDTVLVREMLPELGRTMAAVPLNPEMDLVHIRPGEEYDRCPYGFCDTIRQQGEIFFCSLLYVQACRHMADLCLVVNDDTSARAWRKKAERSAASCKRVFWDNDTGLFRAATVRCREHDIWGSAFAVYTGVADKRQALAIAGYFKKNYRDLVQKGQLRHLPGGVYWEQGCARDTYQNGAYWATPVGWFVYTLDLVDPALADQTVVDMVYDFKENGACEWVRGDKHQLPHYLASAALPLDGIRAMLERRAQNKR